MRLVDQVLYPAVALFLLVLLVFQINTTYATYISARQEQEAATILQNKLASLKDSTGITDHDRALYGNILARQLPGRESLFATLDLSAEFLNGTGLDLQGNTLLKTDGKSPEQLKQEQEKGITIQATGTLTSAELQEMLETYQFEYPRFMTLSSLHVRRKSSELDEIDVNATFNIYTVPEASPESVKESDVQFSVEDAQLFETYKQKVNTGLYTEKTDISPEDTKYEVETSPF